MALRSGQLSRVTMGITEGSQRRKSEQIDNNSLSSERFLKLENVVKLGIARNRIS